MRSGRPPCCCCSRPVRWSRLCWRVVAIGVVYIAAGFGYLAHTAALAAAAALLIDIGRVGAPPRMFDLVLATLIGGVLAVLAHVTFPDDPLTRLAQRAGELLKTETDYVATVIRAYLHEVDGPAGVLDAAWQRAFRARAAFEAAAGAARLDPGVAALAACIPHRAERGDRFVRGAGGEPARRTSTASHSGFVRAVDEYVAALFGEPPTPARPWTVDPVELAAAQQRLRAAAPAERPGQGWARLLVTESAAITRQLSVIAVSPSPSAAR